MARKFLLRTESLGLVGGMATRLKLDYRSFTLPFMPYDRDTQEQLEEGSFINFCIYGSHLCLPPPPPLSPPQEQRTIRLAAPGCVDFCRWACHRLRPAWT